MQIARQWLHSWWLHILYADGMNGMHSEWQPRLSIEHTRGAVVFLSTMIEG